VEVAKQFSIYLENRPGRLASVLAALAADKVNLVALSVMDHNDRATLRLVTSDADRTERALRVLDITPVVTDVLLVELRNQPGALARVCELLGTEHINIDYTYCSSGDRAGKTVAVFKVSQLEKARRVLDREFANPGRRRGDGHPRRDRRTYHMPGGR
jgi:hypothetical protein